MADLIGAYTRAASFVGSGIPAPNTVSILGLRNWAVARGAASNTSLTALSAFVFAYAPAAPLPPLDPGGGGGGAGGGGGE